MAEPIAVAYVEIRPDTSRFQSQTESQVKQSLGGTAQLGAAASKIGKIDLAGTLAPAVAVASTATQEINALAAAVSSVPTTLGSDLGGGLQQAATDTAALGSESLTLSNSLSTSATAAGTLFQKLETAKAATQGLATATLAQAEASQTAATEENHLFSIRARGTHGQGVGPFRIAGAGLAAGVGIFTAVHALNELKTSLEVSGNDALTFRGRMQNLGASLVGGDIVGAFKALANNARSFSLEELKIIEQSPKLLASLKAIGHGGDIQKSQLVALQTLSSPPSRASERVAETAFSGTPKSQISALREEGQRLAEQIKTAREIGKGSDGLNVALEVLFGKRKAVRDQIAALTAKEVANQLAPFEDAIANAKTSGDPGRVLRALQREKTALQAIIVAKESDAQTRKDAQKKLASVNAEIENTQQAIVQQEKDHRQKMIQLALLPSEEAVLNAELGGSKTAEIDALRGRAAELGRLIAKAKDRDERITLKNELISVNSQIESIQQGIVDEAKRHAHEMKQKAQEAHQAVLDSFSLRDLRTQVEQELGVQRQNLQLQRDAINKRIAIFKEEVKTLTGAEQAGAQLALIQAQESLTQLNKTATRDAISKKEQTLKDNVTLAGPEDTGPLRRLIAFEKKQARNRKLSVAERRTHLIEARNDEKSLLRDQISAKEQELKDNVTLAGFTEKTTTDDAAALRKQIAFERTQAHNRKLSRAERRAHLIEERAAERALRDLQKADAAAFQKMSFEFLNTQQGFAANLAGNLLGSTGGLVGGSSATLPTVAPPPITGGRAVDAEVTRGAGGSAPRANQLEMLIHLARQQITQLQLLRGANAHPEARTSRVLSHTGTEVGAA